MKPPLLLLACGALAHEVMAVLRASGLEGVADVQCLPAKLHNTPQAIPEAVREKLRAARGVYRKAFVLYGDCGTGGLLDEVLAEEGAERIAGAHCYEFYTGAADFAAMADADPCSFYLTDFLARHFDRLVIEGLGIDRHPELLPMYFGNYTKLIFLQQLENPALVEKAKAAADRLGLAFEHRFTGYGELRDAIEGAAASVAAPPRRVAGQRG